MKIETARNVLFIFQICSFTNDYSKGAIRRMYSRLQRKRRKRDGNDELNGNI